MDYINFNDYEGVMLLTCAYFVFILLIAASTYKRD
jgi:hypothetical protein